MEWADETDERKNGFLHLDDAGGVSESLRLSAGVISSRSGGASPRQQAQTTHGLNPLAP